MALVRIHPDYTMQVERLYRQWGRELPREPNQIGGPTLPSVTHPSGETELPDAFVDELERMGIPVERC